MSDSSRGVFRVPNDERSRRIEALAWILAALLGSYAIANAVRPMNEYLSMTFGLAETGAGAWWLAQAAITQAPLLFLLMIGIAAVTATRNGGVLACCALTTALLQGMAVALFGNPAEFIEVIEPSLPAGIFTGLVGWALGAGYSLATDGSPNGSTSVTLGDWNSPRDVAELVGEVFFLFFAGYAVVRGVQMMSAYLDRVIGQPSGGFLFFLELYLFGAPVVPLFVLGVALAYATRGGGILVSCALSTMLFLGMGFAAFGFPPRLLNVFYQAVPAGIVLGALGWLLGVGAVRMRHSNRVAPQ